jgi:uncharacterized GH25 family protein
MGARPSIFWRKTKAWHHSALEEKAVRARTDAKGRVTLRLAHAGFWLIKAVHMEAAPADAGVDWESWWASITFDLK